MNKDLTKVAAIAGVVLIVVLGQITSCIKSSHEADHRIPQNERVIRFCMTKDTHTKRDQCFQAAVQLGFDLEEGAELLIEAKEK